jgi:hypothetical protein
MASLTFTEKQRFNRNIIVPIVIILTGFTFGLYGWGIVQQLFLHKTFGDHPISDTGLVISCLPIFILIILIDFLLLKANLVTEINSESIRYRFYPFITRDRYVYWVNVDTATVRKYKPMKEFWGWGIRFNKSGKALNVKGNYGLQLKLTNGKNLLIGTQKPEALEKFLKTLGR